MELPTSESLSKLCPNKTFKTSTIIDTSKYLKNKENSFNDASNSLNNFEFQIQSINSTKIILLRRKRKRARTLCDVKDKQTLQQMIEARNSGLLTPQKCSICLDKIKQKSQLNICKHEFCKSCIDKWAKVSSECPLCKEEFSKIFYFNNKSNSKTEKKISKKHFVPEEEELEAWFFNCDDKCLICSKADNSQELLVCDKCNFRIAHTYCVGLDAIPDGDWYCPECLQKEQKKSHRKKRKKLKMKKIKKKMSNQEDEKDPFLSNSSFKEISNVNTTLRQKNFESNENEIEKHENLPSPELKLRKSKIRKLIKKRRYRLRSKCRQKEGKYSLRESRDKKAAFQKKL